MISRSRRGEPDAPASAPAEQAAGPAADGNASARLRQAAEARASRRQMMARAGGVAAATVAGLTLLDARRAEAANGNNFVLGAANNADSTTALAPTTNADLASPLFMLDGTNLTSTSTTAEIVSTGGATGLVVTASPMGAGTTRTGLAIAANVTGNALGVVGNSASGTAVTGNSSAGTGVVGAGKRGGDFSGKKAAIRLRPGSGAHPHSGLAGDLFVDHLHHLWFCRGGANWVKLA